MSNRGAPVRTTVFTLIVVGTIAALFPLQEIVALANAGTLLAFAAVSTCMLILRRRDPTAARGFRTPAAWLVGPIAIGGCTYLFFSLPEQTKLWFLAWNALGVVIYLMVLRRVRSRGPVRLVPSRAGE